MAGDGHSGFLGTGWSFPPSFDRGSGGVLMVSADEDIRQSLRVLLSTSPGERVMVADYGCDLQPWVFRSLDTTTTSRLKSMVANAILFWEPRITVERIEVNAAPDSPETILIGIDYVVNATNSRSNLVYPYYLDEATLAPSDPGET